MYRPYLEHNLDRMLAIAGSPERLRPHCKTHKTREIIRLLLDQGVTRHKCATLREAAMCIEAGARDIVLAYQLVGPAVEQFASLAAQHPEVQLTALVDTPSAAEALSRAAVAKGVTVGAMVDLDTGLHRTGLPVERAADLSALIARLPGLRPAGLHVYDAQNNAHRDPAERTAAVERTLEPVLELAGALCRSGQAVPELLCGGSGTFPAYARRDSPVVCSPGTSVFWDHGYTERFPDMASEFIPAALVLGRVVSRPMPRHLTLDVGTKAIASDPPAGKRGRILGLEGAEAAVHNEEHWALISDRADQYQVGDHLLIIPTHICPCTNLHPVLYVLDGAGKLIDRWEVAARQRTLAL